jgi:DNA-binding HxlR family transcriptional regulator
MTFAEMKRSLNVTDGNLATHTRKLEEAGLLGFVKAFRGRAPRTEYRLTVAGRHAVENVLGGAPERQGA